MEILQTRVEAPEGAYEFARRQPPEALRRYIDAFEWYAEDTAPQIQRQFPFGRLPFIISLGEGLGVANAGDSPPELPVHHSFMAGLAGTFTDTLMSGRWIGLQLNFTPLGARHLLGRPLGELANRAVELEDLLGRDGKTLVERLQDAPSPERCFDLIEGLIAQRLAANEPVSQAMGWAWNRIRRDPAVSIGILAAECGYSRKHLAERFRSEFGLTPKLAARVLRFERANRTASSTTATPNWAELAATCGYYDQSHLVRDFQQFTGTNPTGYLDYLLFRGVESRRSEDSLDQ